MSKADVVNEIHTNVRVNFPRRRVILKDIDDLWQADLIDMQALSNVNSGYKYIFVIIDCFSKYAWAFPLKQKTKEIVSTVFKTFLAKGRLPKNLQTDMGKEFYNNVFSKIIKKYNINHYSTYSTKKASIVERFIRTFKNKLYKEFNLKGNYKWADGTLDCKIYEYNHTFHRTIGAPPATINHDNKETISQRYAKAQIEQSKKISKCKRFHVGDFVRISKYKGCFEKGYTPNWSTEIFKITKVQDTNPTTYLLEDSRSRPILGAFYEHEIRKTLHPEVYLVEKVLRSKGNKVYVKWLGLPSSENSWIEKTNRL
jgi:transposase InsO family protein